MPARENICAGLVNQLRIDGLTSGVARGDILKDDSDESEQVLKHATNDDIQNQAVHLLQGPITENNKLNQNILRMFARESSNTDNFIKLLLLIASELLVSEMQKYMGVTECVLKI